MTFATYIQSARLGMNINKSEAARRIGITPQYYSDVEKGSIPSEETIAKMVEVLDLEEYQAFKLADKIPPHVYEQAKRDYFNRR